MSALTSRKKILNKLLNKPMPNVLRNSLSKFGISHLTKNTPSEPIKNISEYNMYDLFATDNTEFVKLVYRILLRREADEKGLNFYCGKLAAGTPRIEIIYQVSQSREGKDNNVKLKGLSPILEKYIKGFKTPFGIVYRTIYNISDASIYHTDIISSLNRLQSEINELSVKLSQLETTSISPRLPEESNLTVAIQDIPIEMTLQDFRARGIFNKFKDLVV